MYVTTFARFLEVILSFWKHSWFAAVWVTTIQLWDSVGTSAGFMWLGRRGGNDDGGGNLCFSMFWPLFFYHLDNLTSYFTIREELGRWYGGRWGGGRVGRRACWEKGVWGGGLFVAIYVEHDRVNGRVL